MITYVEGLTDDAFANQFEILFPEGIPGGGDSTLLRLRADKEFEMPEDIVAEYTIEYQGIKIPKIAAKEETDKKLNIAFRLDADWVVFSSLQKWRDLVLNGNTGAGGLEKDTRTSMIFNHYKSNKVLAKSMRFNGVKLFSVKGGSFSHESADPVRVECQFIYVSRDIII